MESGFKKILSSAEADFFDEANCQRWLVTQAAFFGRFAIKSCSMDLHMHGSRAMKKVESFSLRYTTMSRVLFFENEDCTQDDRPTAEGKWLSMVTTSVKRVDLRGRHPPPPVGRLF